MEVSDKERLIRGYGHSSPELEEPPPKLKRWDRPDFDDPDRRDLDSEILFASSAVVGASCTGGELP